MIEESNYICDTYQAKESTRFPSLGLVDGLKKSL